MRHDGRQFNELREIKIERGFIENAHSSVLISFGKTRVICTATVESGVPRFLKDTGSGWVTAEYAMLPACANERIRREVTKGKPSGRTMEIQRLIARSLRAAVDLEALGEISIVIDCDVIQADGGTRTTSITGGMIVLYDVIQKLISEGRIANNPIRNFVSAVSLGVVNGQVVTDLDYVEDSSADVDLNLVMTDDGRFIEIQGTAEQEPFSSEQLGSFLALGQASIQDIIAKAKQALMVVG
ncbi:MAG: ribonuclease PH [Candidatus Margulisiibacteriota bacterium]